MGAVRSRFAACRQQRLAKRGKLLGMSVTGDACFGRARSRRLPNLVDYAILCFLGRMTQVQDRPRTFGEKVVIGH